MAVTYYNGRRAGYIDFNVNKTFKTFSNFPVLKIIFHGQSNHKINMFTETPLVAVTVKSIFCRIDVPVNPFRQ